MSLIRHDLRLIGHQEDDGSFVFPPVIAVAALPPAQMGGPHIFQLDHMLVNPPDFTADPTSHGVPLQAGLIPLNPEEGQAADGETEDGKAHCCPTCKKAFNQISNLKTHMRVHTGEKPFLCFDCGKCFSQFGNLKTHQRLHQDDKRYECPHCRKKFIQKGNLQAHLRTHSGEKPYQCAQCGKSFVTSSDLKRHERVHSGEKPYPCRHCDKTFGRSSTLRQHERVHTGDKPYTCRYCDKTFNDRSHRAKHERTHTRAKFRCPHCPSTFSHRASVVTHVATIHTDAPPLPSFTCRYCPRTFLKAQRLEAHERLHANGAVAVTADMDPDDEDGDDEDDDISTDGDSRASSDQETLDPPPGLLLAPTQYGHHHHHHLGPMGVPMGSTVMHPLALAMSVPLIHPSETHVFGTDFSNHDEPPHPVPMNSINPMTSIGAALSASLGLGSSLQ